MGANYNYGLLIHTQENRVEEVRICCTAVRSQSPCISLIVCVLVEQAEKHYEAVLAVDPKHTNALYNLGMIMHAHHAYVNLDHARDHCRVCGYARQGAGSHMMCVCCCCVSVGITTKRRSITAGRWRSIRRTCPPCTATVRRPPWLTGYHIACLENLAISFDVSVCMSASL